MMLRKKMMMFLICIPNLLLASGEDKAIGGRTAAMGGVSAAASGLWSVINNPAGLGSIGKFSAGMYGDNRFLLKELNTFAAGLVIPLGHGGLGIMVEHYGFSLYNETRAACAYGKKFSRHFYAGVQLDYLRLHSGEGNPPLNLFTCGAGVQYTIKDRLTIGFNLYNPIMTRIKTGLQERIPATLRLGLAWQLSSQLVTIIEAEKESSKTPVLKAGMEYKAGKSVQLRVGFYSGPTTVTFGAGFLLGPLNLDISSSYNLVLGYSPQVSVMYSIK